MIKYTNSYVFKKFLTFYGLIAVLSAISMLVFKREYQDYLFPMIIFPILLFTVHVTYRHKNAIDVEDHKLVFYELFIVRRRYDLGDINMIKRVDNTIIIPVKYKKMNKKLIVKDVYTQSIDEIYSNLLKKLKE